MPHSSPAGKGFIVDWVNARPHAVMLDIGCGAGTYPRMIRATWDGVEIWEPYIAQFDLTSLYRVLYLEDARTWAPSETYDIAIAGDVLEHMEPEEAKALFERLRACAKTVIVSIPIGHYPQGEWGGNPYERHVKDDWTDEDVRHWFGEPNCAVIDGEIGVYLWE